MGKKRGKDKSSREEDTDVIGRIYHMIISYLGIWQGIECLLIFTVNVLFSGPSCRHIKKGTDQTLLKKLSGNSKWTNCQDCKDEENKENNYMEQDCDEEQETPAIWMCLKCGHSVSILKYFIHLCTKVSKGADLF